MESESKEALPARFRQLVVVLEQAISDEIRLRPASEGDEMVRRVCFSNGLPLNDIDRRTGSPKITIWLPNGPIAPHSLAHELMHSEARLLGYFPQLVGLDRVGKMHADYLSNDLEHAMIVPEEIREFGQEAESYWLYDLNKQFELTKRLRDQRMLVRSVGLTSVIFPQTDLLERIQETVTDWGLATQANEYTQAISLAGEYWGSTWAQGHLKQTARALEALDIPLASFAAEFHAGPHVGMAAALGQF